MNLVHCFSQKNAVCGLSVVYKSSIGRTCVHVCPVRREENTTTINGECFRREGGNGGIK